MKRAQLPNGVVLEFPDETPDDVMDRAVKRFLQENPIKPAEPAPVRQIEPPPPGFRDAAAGTLRKAELASRGLTDSVLEGVGSLPDAAAWLFRQAGLPSTPPGFYSDTLKEGFNAAGRAVSAPLTAMFPDALKGEQTTADELVYGAGRGVGDAAKTLIPGALVSKAAPAGSLVQRSAQALTAQPVMQAASGAAGGAVGEVTDNPLLGAAAALAVPLIAATGGRAVSPVRSRLTGEEARLAEVAAREGVPLTPAQKTGSKPLKTLESVFGDLPFTSGPQAKVAASQQSAFNSAVLRRAGMEADNAAPEVLSAARDRFGREFTKLTKATTVSLDDQFLGDLQGVVSTYGDNLDALKKPIFDKVVKDVLDTNGTLSGEVYQKTRSTLSRLAKSYRSSDPEFASATRGLRDALDDAAARALPEGVKPEWDDLRAQYGAFKAIERAMTNSTAAATAGDIPPTQLSAAIRAQDPSGYAQGRGQLNELARIGTAFVRDNVPNSGTSQRTALMQLMQGGSPGALAAAYGSGGDPLSMAAGAAATAFGPRAVQMAYNSPAGQAYLNNEIAKALGLRPGSAAGILGTQINQAVPALLGR